MMCSELDQFYTGKVLTNKYEAFELLVLFLLQKEGSLTYSYHNNEKMGLDISFEKEKLKISLNYDQDSALFEGYCKVDLKISFFMNPFYFKRYTVSDTKRFSNLTKVVNIMRMSSIFKRVINKNRNIFGLLNKKTFTLILSFLNKESISNLSQSCYELKEIFKIQYIWKCLFEYRYPNLLITCKNLDWKRCFLEEKKSALTKIVSTSTGNFRYFDNEYKAKFL